MSRWGSPPGAGLTEAARRAPEEGAAGQAAGQAAARFIFFGLGLVGRIYKSFVSHSLPRWLGHLVCDLFRPHMADWVAGQFRRPAQALVGALLRRGAATLERSSAERRSERASLGLRPLRAWRWPWAGAWCRELGCGRGHGQGHGAAGLGVAVGMGRGTAPWAWAGP